MLTCVHHIQWVRPVENGLHQCILCMQVVGRKDVYPKLEDVPEALRRWEEHEARAAAAAAEKAARAHRAAPGGAVAEESKDPKEPDLAPGRPGAPVRGVSS